MKEFGPDVKVTRGELMLELLTMWEETRQIMDRNPNGTDAKFGAKAELDAAIYVLKRTFTTFELMSRDSYEYVRKVVDAGHAIREEYERSKTLIETSEDLPVKTRELKIMFLTKAFENDLSKLDKKQENDNSSIRSNERKPDHAGGSTPTA